MANSQDLEDERETDTTPFLHKVEEGPDEVDGDGDESPLISPRSRAIQAWTKALGFWAWLVVGLVVLSAILVGGFIAVSHRTGSCEDVFVDTTTAKGYILDPEWDFDAAPKRRHYHWTVTEEIRRPDGTDRPMMLINQQFPGPMVEVNEGDTLVIRVENRASNATSIHWHGLYQNGSNWQDGTTGVTQCPIGPGANYTYEFTVQRQAGTYWYHAHNAVQTADGLFGPLVIHSGKERALQPPYASDRVVMVQDYYRDLSAQLLLNYLEPDNENAEPVPDGALINGRPSPDCVNASCVVDEANIFALERGQSHRLRFINVGVFATFQVEVDGHALDVTEVDGTDVQATKTDALIINPAQRYSVVVSANHTQTDSFWLRAGMNTNCFFVRTPFDLAQVNAIVHYPDSLDSPSGVADVTMSTTPATIVPAAECNDMNLEPLRPALPVAAPAKPDASFYIRTNFQIGAHRLSRGFFNSSSLRPSVGSPTLHRLIDGIGRQNTSFSRLQEPPVLPPSMFGPEPFPALQHGIGVNAQAYHASHELVLQTPATGKVVDFVFVNFDDGAHPLHLHGHKFFVLGQGKGYPPQSIMHLADDDQPTDLDLSNPLRRDTALVQDYGWIHLRVVLDNAGVWLFHCHNAWHAEAGMGMVLAVGVDEIVEDVRRENADERDVVGWVEAVRQQQEDGCCGGEAIERGERPPDSLWDDP
jgi:FtsP/CotA-like multicopper oxidase with cupredoxin domain